MGGEFILVFLLSIYRGILSGIKHLFIPLHELCHLAGVHLAGLPVSKVVLHHALADEYDKKEMKSQNIGGYVKYSMPVEPAVSSIIGMAPLLFGLFVYSSAFLFFEENLERDAVIFAFIFFSFEFLMPSREDVKINFYNFKYALNSILLLPITGFVYVWQKFLSKISETVQGHFLFLFPFSLLIFFICKIFSFYILFGLLISVLVLLSFRVQSGIIHSILNYVFYIIFPFSLVFWAVNFFLFFQYELTVLDLVNQAVVVIMVYIDQFAILISDLLNLAGIS